MEKMGNMITRQNYGIPVCAEGKGRPAFWYSQFPVTQFLFISTKLLLTIPVLGADIGMTIFRMCPKAGLSTANSTTQVTLVVLPASLSVPFGDP